MSNLLNLVFMNADILLLGAMTTVTSEVGRYSAACKPLYIIFTGFWLLTDALYPQVAKIEGGPQAYRSLLFGLSGLAIIASAAARWVLPISVPRANPHADLRIDFGCGATVSHPFDRIAPRFLLLIAMDRFLVSRGYERSVLYSTGAAAGFNDVLLNLILIRRFQANAAAWVTVASWPLLFSVLLVFVLRNKILSDPLTGDVPEISAAWAVRDYFLTGFARTDFTCSRVLVLWSSKPFQYGRRTLRRMT